MVLSRTACEPLFDVGKNHDLILLFDNQQALYCFFKKDLGFSVFSSIGLHQNSHEILKPGTVRHVQMQTVQLFVEIQSKL
jgi:hypothetical protein